MTLLIQYDKLGIEFANAYPEAALKNGFASGTFAKFCTEKFGDLVNTRALTAEQIMILLTAKPDRVQGMTPEKWALLTKKQKLLIISQTNEENFYLFTVEVLQLVPVPRLLKWLALEASSALSDLEEIITDVLKLTVSQFWTRHLKYLTSEEVSVSVWRIPKRVLLITQLFHKHWTCANVWNALPQETQDLIFHQLQEINPHWWKTHQQKLQAYGYQVSTEFVVKHVKETRYDQLHRSVVQGRWYDVTRAKMARTSEEHKIELIKQSWRAIDYIENPTQHMVDLAVAQNPYAAILLKEQ